MKINSLALAYFSPTGTTKSVLSGIAAGMGAEEIKLIDLTCETELAAYNAAEFELTVIGIPVYCSRIPAAATALVNSLKGHGKPVVLVAVYGNNKFGDALLELKDITESNGFCPIAAAAFVGEHSFSHTDKPIAAGRPDAEDLVKAKTFGNDIKQMLLKKSVAALVADLTIPGDFPYCDGCALAAQPPTSEATLCTLCGKCVTVCPVNSITISDKIVTDAASCIFCCACVKACPVDSRRITDQLILDIQQRLCNNCSERKEPEFFGV